MSTSASDLRPARTTPNLGLPVPGDAGPADYVTDTGRLADRLDEVAAAASNSGPNLPADPPDGATFDWTPGSLGGRVAVMWRMRASDGQWWFIGGPFVGAYDGNGIAIPTALNAWTAQATPVLTVPATGLWEVGGNCDMQMFGSIDYDCSPAGSGLNGVTARVFNNSTTNLSVTVAVQPFAQQLSAGEQVRWWARRNVGTGAQAVSRRLLIMRPVVIGAGALVGPLSSDDPARADTQTATEGGDQ